GRRAPRRTRAARSPPAPRRARPPPWGSTRRERVGGPRTGRPGGPAGPRGVRRGPGAAAVRRSGGAPSLVPASAGLLDPSGELVVGRVDHALQHQTVRRHDLDPRIADLAG